MIPQKKTVNLLPILDNKVNINKSKFTEKDKNGNAS